MKKNAPPQTPARFGKTPSNPRMTAARYTTMRRAHTSPTLNNNNMDKENKNYLGAPGDCQGSSFLVPETPYKKFKLPSACSTQIRAKKTRHTPPSDSSDNSSFDEDSLNDSLFTFSEYLQRHLLAALIEEKIKEVNSMNNLIDTSGHMYVKFASDITKMRSLCKDIYDMKAFENELQESLINIDRKLEQKTFDSLKITCDDLKLTGISLNVNNTDVCVCDKKIIMMNDVAELGSSLMKLNADRTTETVDETVCKKKECQSKMEDCQNALKKLAKLLEELNMLALEASSINLIAQ